MEQLHQFYAKIQAIVGSLIKTSHTAEELNDFKSQLNAHYKQFNEAAEQLKPTLVIQDEITEFENLSVNAKRTFSLAEEGIKNRLDKMTTTVNPKPQEDFKPESMQPTPSTSKIIPASGPLQVQPPTGPEATDMGTLRTLLQQITGQFNQIIAGEYPKRPTTQIALMVGNSHSSEEGESDEEVGAPRKNAGTKAQKNATTPHPSIPPPPSAIPVNPMPQPMAPCPAVPLVDVNPDAIQQPRVELKMNRFTLPTFDGDLTNWLPFRDQFIDLIDSNRSYTSITKFIQLRAHLKGSALEAIQGFKLSAASYDAAWYILQRRYNKPDQIIDEYLRKLTDLPPIFTPTAQKLITMVNCTNQILRVLPTLGVDVANWDAIIKYNLTSKLDRATYKKWLDQVKLRQNVPLEELIEFLEVEASEILPLPARAIQQHDNRGRQQPRGRHQPAAILAAVAANPAPVEASDGRESKCPQCKGPHALFQCQTFKRMKVKDRINKVRAFKACFRCLNKHREPSECKFGMCPVCTKDHNTLLCYTKEKQTREGGARVATLHSNDA